MDVQNDMIGGQMMKYFLSSLGYKDSHIPSFADDDVIEIFLLKAPVWEFKFGKLLSEIVSLKLSLYSEITISFRMSFMMLLVSVTQEQVLITPQNGTNFTNSSIVLFLILSLIVPHQSGVTKVLSVSILV